MSLCRSALIGLLLSLIAPLALNAQGLGPANLLSNGDFESGLTGWTTVTGTAVSGIYGDPSRVPLDVAAYIGGNSTYLKHQSGSTCAVEQVVDVSSFASLIASGAELDLSAYIGALGNDQDTCNVVVEFLQGATLLGNGSINGPDRLARNREDVLVKRRGLFPVPAGCDTIRVTLDFVYLTGSQGGSIDLVYAELVPTTVPTALPTNTQLLVNADFESGWTATSPLTLNDPTGWEVAVDHTRVLGYGETNALTLGVGTALNAGARYLQDSGGDGELFQVLDVRGNQSDILAGALELVVSADQGGHGTDSDQSELFVEFLDAGGLVVGSELLEPITRNMRLREAVLLRRGATWSIPTTTASIRVTLRFNYISGSPDGAADQIDVRLVPTSAPTAKPLNTNLVFNGDFESGWTASSPLVLDQPTTWIGDSNSGCERVNYGDASWPSAAVSTTLNAGNSLIRDLGNCELIQLIDLRGNSADIQAGNLNALLSADLGAMGTDSDNATVILEFLDLADAPVGTLSVGPVLRNERNDEDVLMRREAEGLIPANTARVRVRCDAVFATGNPGALIDTVSFKLVTPQTPAPNPLGVNLLSNGDFESGWDCNHGATCGTCTSPLQLENPRSWTATGLNVVSYGAPSTPSLTFATAANGGCSLIQDSGNEILRQRVDVSGNAAQIDAQDLVARLDALVGGVGTSNDDAILELLFYSANGGQLAVIPAAETLSVNSSDRGGQDVLLPREVEAHIPVGTREIEVVVRLRWFTGTPSGLVDNVSLTLVDCTGSGQVNTVDARLDVNGIGGIACPGPHDVAIPVGGSITFRWSGPATAPLILAVGEPAATPLSLGGFGLLDLDVFQPITVVFDGTQGTWPEVLFRLDNNGEAFQSFSVPFSGASVTIQGAILQPPGASSPVRLTAAFNLSFL